MYTEFNEKTKEGRQFSTQELLLYNELNKRAKPLEESVRVFRGETAREIGETPLEPGQVTITVNWTATSMNPATAVRHGGEGARVWDIEVPEGHRGAFLGFDNDREAEIVLPPGTGLRVLRIEPVTGHRGW